MDINKKFERYQDRIIKEAVLTIAYEKRKAALKICESAVDRFYNDYTPHMYKRRGSLYEAYNIEIKPNGEFIFQLGSEFMTKKHRVDNEYIYKYMFVMGWHGGANDGKGHPDLEITDKERRRLFWRQPYKDRIEEDGSVTKQFSLWDSKPAAQIDPNDRYRTNTPYQTIKREWNNYIKKELRQMEIDTWRSVLKKYLK